MGRIIKTDSIGKKRLKLEREVSLALRELLHQPEPSELTRDMAAFIGLALLEISETIDGTVAAWEKRNYWLKADRFRLDWEWTSRVGNVMCQAVLNEDWGSVARQAVEVAGRLKHVRLPTRHRLGTPWTSAWIELKRRSIAKQV